jgi:hypothetical protein
MDTVLAFAGLFGGVLLIAVAFTDATFSQAIKGQASTTKLKTTAGA